MIPISFEMRELRWNMIDLYTYCIIVLSCLFDIFSCHFITFGLIIAMLTSNRDQGRKVNRAMLSEDKGSSTSTLSGAVLFLISLRMEMYLQ